MEVEQLESAYSISNMLDGCKEISDSDKVRIKYILLFLLNIKDRQKKVLDSVREGKYSEATRDMNVCDYLNWNPVLKEMKEDLFKYGSATLINRIAEKQPFITRSGTYSESAFSIPIDVLPKFHSYSDTASKDHPKAIAYKILGAKVI